MKKTFKLVFISLLISQALIISLIERSIPPPFMTPGAKLGLANVITCIALYTLTKRETITVIILRVILASFFGGTLYSMIYSVMGASFSFIAMSMVKEIGKDKVSIIGVSVMGGVFHNVGQLTVACYVVENIWVMLYLPMLTLTGIATGIFIGMVSNYLLKHLNKLNVMDKIYN